MLRRPLTVVATTMAAALLAAQPVLAGPPLVCFPFEIGNARSLPIVHTGYGAVDPKYDVSRLSADTIELLDAKTPVIVHMETMRRAALYALANRPAGADLLAKVRERAGKKTENAPLAVFDFGYLVETYRQAGVHLADDIDGYVWVQKAIALQKDPQMEFAAALISAWPKRADHTEHVRNATAGAANDPLLSRNLPGHLQEPE